MAALVLLSAAWALAVLSVADLVFAITAGGTLVFGPGDRTCPRLVGREERRLPTSARLAIWADATALALTVVAILLFGGS